MSDSARPLIDKLQAMRPAVEASKAAVVQYVEDVVQRQRELEGIRAAMRDPVSGKVFVGWTHKAAIDAVPQEEETGIWGRLHSEWDACTDNAGFVDRSGNFISRTEAEARWNVLTMEDVKDAREASKPARPLPRG